MSRKIKVWMDKGEPEEFEGDLEMAVNDAGTLTIMNYDDRKRGIASPVVCAAGNGFWRYAIVSEDDGAQVVVGGSDIRTLEQRRADKEASDAA